MELRDGYKQSEVGVIPEDWEVSTIGRVMNLVNGRAFKPVEWKQAGTPIIRIQNLNNQETSFNYHDGKVDEKNRVDYGDILFAWSGTTGTSFGARIWSGVSGVLNQHIFKVLPNLQKLTPVYTFLILEQVQESIEKQAHGFKASFVHVKKSDLVKVSLPLPPLLEQRAIATALSDVDALLDSLEELIAKKRDLKQAAMQQLLTGQQRLEGFSGAWEVKRLGDVARIQRGASPRPIDDPIWFDETSAIGWVRISDVTKSGIYLDKTLQKLSSIGVNHSRFVPSKSLIMSICATVGRPVITDIDVCIHDGFVVFDQLEENKLFVYYFLKYIESDWFKYGQTGSQMNLNTDLINGTKIGLPPLLEQQAIATILSDMDAEIAALEARRDKTKALKHGMMQELLTGKTRLV